MPTRPRTVAALAAVDCCCLQDIGVRHKHSRMLIRVKGRESETQKRIDVQIPPRRDRFCGHSKGIKYVQR